MFECVVARSLWDLFEEVFDVHVINFESIASKWLCNKKFMHFNVASSAVLWGLWLNRNSLVFNKITWINVKQVWRRILFLLRDWTKLFIDLESGRNGQFVDLLLASLKAPLCPPSGVSCPSFDWISSWNSSYEGRATLTYLLDNPGKSHKIHVVT
jgi:hypothetical protein